jgi:hypothetical protein
MEELKTKIKFLEKKYAENKTWHDYSQSEANAMKNYNQALKDVLNLIEEYEKGIL